MVKAMIFFPFRPQWLATLIVVFAIALSGCQQGKKTEGQDLIRSQAWRMDASNQDTLINAEAAVDWLPMTDWKSWWFGPETIWIRVQLRASEASENTPWVVRVRPPTLDYVTLYDPATGRVLRTGDAVPPVDDVSSINFSLPITPLPYERAIYLQVRSTSARTLQVEVLPYEQAQRMNRLQEWLMAFTTAASATLAIWAMSQWWVTREPLIGTFALKQILSTAWAFFVMGFARIVIGPTLPEGLLTAMTSTVFSWTISAGIWFYYSLLRGYQPATWTIRVCQTIMVITAILPILQWAGYALQMLSIANIFVLMTLAMLIITLLSAFPKQVKQPIPHSILLTYLLIYSTFNALPGLINLGWIRGNSMVLFGGFAQALLDGVGMFILLGIRTRRLQHEQHQIALDLQVIQEKAATEKQHREEQSQLFAMLAHEMKTPLASMRMWMEAGQLQPETMERSIADMNHIIERCVQTGQLAEQGLRPISQCTSPVEITRQCIQTCRASERVDFDAPRTDEMLHTDAQMLSIVLSNLLDNACKYAAPQSRIQVNLTPANQDGHAGWSWQISNLVGPIGLPDPDQLFAKYYRSPRALSLSGSGLGLFLVKGLLELLQASIYYQTKKDQVIFSIWVPNSLSAS